MLNAPIHTAFIRIASDGVAKTVQWSPEYQRERNMKATINVDYLLNNVEYFKTAGEIVEKCRIKIASLSNKIEERKGRIKAIRTEHQIDDAALVELLTAMRKNADQRSFSYSTGPMGDNSGRGSEERTIAAGTVNALLTESDFIESEKAQVEKLDLIVRNLKPVRRFSSDGTELPDAGFNVGHSDLRYLGF